MNPITIELHEQDGINRSNEPVSCGIPLVKGEVRNVENLQLTRHDDKLIPASFSPLAWWHDKSIKWVLADFQADLAANEKKQLLLTEADSSGDSVPSGAGIRVEEREQHCHIDTGACQYVLSASGLLCLSSAVATGTEALSSPMEFTLTDEHDKSWQPFIESCVLERSNPLRLIISYSGVFKSGNTAHFIRFKSRIHFFAGKGTIRIDFGIWNPRAALHKQGVWDLGDGHSFLFKELRLGIPCAGDAHCQYTLSPEKVLRPGTDDLLIYQDSSGGENWQSPVHVNRNDKIPVSFKGYEVYANGKVLSRGERATPAVALVGEQLSCTCTMPYFWQNFPKALSCRENCIYVHFFPVRFADLYELQGGEQKTHTLYVHFGTEKPADLQEICAAIHHPLVAHVESQQYFAGGIAPRPVPVGSLGKNEICTLYQEYITTAIHGERSFVRRREIIDEYGWRNFGEMYADHEAVQHAGDSLFISHYNNQYDGIKGGLIQFMRTGDRHWYHLAGELAGHVADIDIYRTGEDRYEYNNGLFWHTDHHVPAATATHRTTSVKHFTLKDPRFVGGGPSYEHNYSSGFCYSYWMTGEEPFKECVLLFADYVICGLDGPDTLLEWTKNAVTRLKYKLTSTGSTQFGSPYGLTSGPGRGSGNGLNTLVDAYLITADEKYLHKAAWLIRQCVGPDDDIVSRDLLNAELRWMYLIFFQALGRYLDVCVEREQWDEDFQYARLTFVNYAEWMRQNEYPYLEKTEILEFPNETWAAQDMRKADILALAARYCTPNRREKFLQKSRFFFEKTLEHVVQFGDNSYLTRPIVVLMTNGLTCMEIMQDIGAEPLPSFKEQVASAESSSLGRAKTGGLGKLWKILKNTSLKKELSWLQVRLRSR